MASASYRHGNLWQAVLVTVVPGFQAKFMTASLKSLPRYARSLILGRVMASMRD